MFEKLRIKQHMEVTDSGGRHLGTVDSVDGDTIKLTRSDSTDGQHHYLSFDDLDRIEDNRAYLKAGVNPQVRAAEQQHATGTQQSFSGGTASTSSDQSINPNEYSSHRPTDVGEGSPLFGTSGHGTGMGGSGVGH